MKSPAKTPWWPKFLNESPDDFYFKPNRAEVKTMRLLRQRARKLEQLEAMKAKWEVEDLERLRSRVAQYGTVIEIDRVKQKQVDEREELVTRHMAEVAKITAYYESEHAKEFGALRKKADKLGKLIARDKSKAERAVLLARGVVRGRRK